MNFTIFRIRQCPVLAMMFMHTFITILIILMEGFLTPRTSIWEILLQSYF